MRVSDGERVDNGNGNGLGLGREEFSGTFVSEND
jgi:hypothetical protein